MQEKGARERNALYDVSINWLRSSQEEPLETSSLSLNFSLRIIPLLRLLVAVLNWSSERCVEYDSGRSGFCGPPRRRVPVWGHRTKATGPLKGMVPLIRSRALSLKNFENYKSVTCLA